MKKVVSSFVGLTAVFAFSALAVAHEHDAGASGAAPGRIVHGQDHPDTVLHDHGHYDHMDHGKHKGEGHAEQHKHHHEHHEHHHADGAKK